MSILADKVLSVLAFPLGLVLLTLLIVTIASLWRHPRPIAILSMVLTLVLWCLSTPYVAGYLTASLEDQFPALRVETYPDSDVAIVLGGAMGPPGDVNPYPDLSEAGDRVLHAYRIFKAGKAKMLLLSGGATFGSGTGQVEAEAMADLLVSLGIDRSAILVEPRSRNTYENAIFSRDIWKQKGFSSGLLVTSALHMPRSVAIFHKAGMAVVPASTDAGGRAGGLPFPLPVLPDAASLMLSTKALKEWLGLYVYRWRGWA